MATNESGFLQNPDEQVENEVTLADIKDDTEGILNELKSTGRQNVDLAVEANKIAKQTVRNTDASGRKIEVLLEKGVLLQQRSLKSAELRAKKQQNLPKQHSQKKAEKAPLADSPNPVKPQTTAEKIEQARAKREAVKQAPPKAQSPQTAQQKIAREKGENKPTESSELPHGWTRNKKGRIRDEKGRFVNDDELAKYGLSHPESKNKADTEREASESRVLDSLKDIKEAIAAPENVDPMIEASKEAFAPIAKAFTVGKTVTTTMGRGLQKIFGGSKEKEEQRRFSQLFSFFRKSDKTSEKRENKIIDWLRKIWKKDGSKGGGLFGLLTMLAGLIITPLKLFATKSLGGLGLILKGISFVFRSLGIGKVLGWLGKGVGSIFGGLAKGAGSIFGDLGKSVKGAGKGFLKRVPILGSLLAFADGGAAGGIGSIIGGAIGTIFGPIGTVIGGLIGEKIGVWLAELDWKAIGNQISAAWESTTKWLSETWNSALTWFDNTFPELSKSMKEMWKTSTDWISEKWNAVADSFNEYWAGASEWVSDKWEQVTKSLLETWEKLTGWIGEKWQGVKDSVSGAWDWTTEKAGNAWDWVSDGVGNLFGSSEPQADQVSKTNIELTAKHTDNVNVNTANLNKEHTKTNSTLESISKWLGDTYSLMKEMMNELLNKEPNETSTTNALFNNDNSVVSSVASNAADYAATKAAAKSLGECAKFVNEALRAQGIKIYGHGRDVASNLLNSGQGFEKVEYNQDYVPQIGDVMSMPSSSKSTHNYGHVAIYTKEGWVSDFKQGEKYGNTGAANVHYFNDIQAGRIKPTIARKSLSLTERYMASANQVADNVSVQSGSIAGLSAEQTQAYLAKVVSKESGGRLDVVNQYGYMGLYQHGAAALVEAGLIDRNKYNAAVKMNKGIANGSDAKAHTAFLDDPNNWTIQGGKQAFLSSKALQDKAMIDSTNKNAEYLRKGGVFTGSAEHKAGLLMAAHLKGHSGAIRLARGIDSADGNGMKASTYYKEAFEAVKNARVGTAVMTEPPFTGLTQRAVNVATNAASVPKINAPKSTSYPAMASEIHKARPKEQESKTDKVIAVGQDPIFQFLTQDVSERRIAHIVTGGLLREARMV